MKTMLDINKLRAPSITVLPNGWTVHMANGLIHREGGPAVISENHKEWYQNSKRHNPDGPAVLHKITSDGRKNYAEWWMNGKLVMHGSVDDATFAQHWSK